MSVILFDKSEWGRVLACARKAASSDGPQVVAAVDRNVGDWLGRMAKLNAEAWNARYGEHEKPVGVNAIREAANGMRVTAKDCGGKDGVNWPGITYNAWESEKVTERDQRIEKGITDGVLEWTRPAAQARRERGIDPRDRANDNLGATEAAAAMRKGLNKRAPGLASVTRGTGTAYSWLHVDVAPKRRTCDWQGTAPATSEHLGYSCAPDRARLKALLDLASIHPQGEQIPPTQGCRAEWIARAEGRKPTIRCGAPDWD